MLLCLWPIRPNGSVQLVCDNQTSSIAGKFTVCWSFLRKLQTNYSFDWRKPAYFVSLNRSVMKYPHPGGLVMGGVGMRGDIVRRKDNELELNNAAKGLLIW